MEKTVIDLSKFNTIKDYSAFAAACDGVILRIGYRSYEKGILTEDPVFKTHYANLIGKVPIGVYFFTTAVNEQEAVEEADWVIKKLKSYSISLAFPIAVDTEIADVKNKKGRSDSLDKVTRTKVVDAFCKRCIASGYTAMIYAADSWFTSQLVYDDIVKYPKWVARYSSNKPKVSGNVVGWQKTDAYKIAGSTKGVDMSEWYGDIAGEKVSVPATSTPTKMTAGGSVVLKNANLYSSSGSTSAVKKITGTYYYWDTKVVNNKVRITSKAEYVGNAGKVTGWVDSV